MHQIPLPLLLLLLLLLLCCGCPLIQATAFGNLNTETLGKRGRPADFVVVDGQRLRLADHQADYSNLRMSHPYIYLFAPVDGAHGCQAVQGRWLGKRQRRNQSRPGHDGRSRWVSVQRPSHALDAPLEPWLEPHGHDFNVNTSTQPHRY